MTEPIESPQFESEESEALSVANDLAGGDDWQVEEGGLGDDSSAAIAASSGEGGAPPAAPSVPGTAGSQSLTLDQVRQRWQQNNMTRAALRGELEKQYAERQRYEDMANAILRAQQAQQPQPVQQPEPPQIDPELQRYFDTQQQNLLGQVQQLLAPVLSQAQQAQQVQQVQQQVSQEQQQWGEFRQIVESAEQDYMATPEGQGYVERVSGFETALRKTCEYAGLAPQVAQKLVNEDMKGMAVLAMSLNIPPPVFVDAYARAMYEWAQGQGANGNGRVATSGNGRQPVQQRQQGRVSPQVQIARMATQAGAVGAPPSGGMVQSGATVDVGTLLQRGLTGKDIDSLVKEHGSLSKAMNYLDRLGMELEQIEG